MSDSDRSPGGANNSRPLEWWLQRLEQMQPDRIELGLARIQRVALACGLANPDFDIITVAGTNGKGSTVALAAGILQECGYRVGVYTSPHFIDFNERIAVDAKRADEALLCEAFDLIDSKRGNTDLTYFEFTTLAAIYCFSRANVDVAVLEVGLGGRLDAVNAWDSQVACITSIGIDHIDWLGDNLESIGREKAGVARAGCPLVCGEKNVPQSINETASSAGAILLQMNEHFSATIENGSWCYRGPRGEILLPIPAISGDWAVDNAAVAITAVAEYLGRLPDHNAIAGSLIGTTISGRMQQITYRSVPVLLDVAHNQQAAAALAGYLLANPRHTIAVFACMQDKDATTIVSQISIAIDQWMVAQLDFPRAVDALELVALIKNKPSANVEVFTSVIQAFESAVAQSTVESRVVVFGSFHVVGPVLEFLAAQG